MKQQTIKHRVIFFALLVGVIFWSLQPGYADEKIDAELAKVIVDLKHPDLKVAHEAFAAIRHKYRQRAEAAIPTLIELIKTDSGKTDHTQVCKSLSAIGRAAMIELAKLVETGKEDDWRARALYTFKLGGAVAPDVTIPSLVSAMNDPNPDIRYEALRALPRVCAKRSKEAVAAVPDVAKLLHDKDEQVRLYAASVLASIGPAAKPAAPVLISQLEEDDFTKRSFAISTLSSIGPGAREATGTLIPFLKDEVLQEDVASALRAIGLNGEEDVNALIEILGHEQSRPRQLAVSLLAGAGPDAKAAVRSLIAALDDAQTRQLAIDALGRIGPDAKPAVPYLMDLLAHDDAYFIRAGAAQALGRIGAGAKVAVTALRTASTNPHALVIEHAEKALRLIHVSDKP